MLFCVLLFPVELSLLRFLSAELTRGYFLEHNEAKYTERRERVYTCMRIPRELEKLMFFGIFLCLDAFLYVFTLLPLRVLLALFRLLTLPCYSFRHQAVQLIFVTVDMERSSEILHKPTGIKGSGYMKFAGKIFAHSQTSEITYQILANDAQTLRGDAPPLHPEGYGGRRVPNSTGKEGRGCAGSVASVVLHAGSAQTQVPGMTRVAPSPGVVWAGRALSAVSSRLFGLAQRVPADWPSWTQTAHGGPLEVVCRLPRSPCDQITLLQRQARHMGLVESEAERLQMRFRRGASSRGWQLKRRDSAMERRVPLAAHAGR
ncbi:Transmembrane anterior posterior transformation protein 1 [Galemys pyrenaicus]|uniref:Transmembrane anterior posterior transformation protein 1 n=1 Tax=Galemys pyrenaicus TaxID=202257 RepID=A0A8J6DJS4_GALPY|nr:Transmembrane anterior posterior transformation protein 1 [Galemys pyrenaicus]